MGGYGSGTTICGSRVRGKTCPSPRYPVTQPRLAQDWRGFFVDFGLLLFVFCRVRQRPHMIEHFAEIASVKPSAAGWTFHEMLSFVFW
jgi:hypothetical protein